ncbi:MAG: hypothetical protein ACT4TC_06545, partial [Myxococcaceae bacterium]
PHGPGIEGGAMDYPLDDSPVFHDPSRRERITEEPQPDSHRPDPRFPDLDWVNTEAQAHSGVPPDYEWTSNPKQEQDDAAGG